MQFENGKLICPLVVMYLYLLYCHLFNCHHQTILLFEFCCLEGPKFAGGASKNYKILYHFHMKSDSEQIEYIDDTIEHYDVLATLCHCSKYDVNHLR